MKINLVLGGTREIIGSARRNPSIKIMLSQEVP